MTDNLLNTHDLTLIRSSDDERLSSPVDDERLSSPGDDGFILVEEAEETLRDARPINLDNIKESCMVHIDRYINSRGTITVDGNFDPSWVTKIFRNQRTTLDKVTKMVDLKGAIDSATSYDDIREALDTLLSDESAVKATFGSGVKRALERCLSSVEVGEKSDLELHNAHQASP